MQPSSARKAESATDPAEDDDAWVLRLYIAGETPKSQRALTNLRALCDEDASGRFRIEVIDLLAQPELAQRDQIVAIPTLVRKLPQPMRKIIGDLSDRQKVLVGLEMRQA